MSIFNFKFAEKQQYLFIAWYWTVYKLKQRKVIEKREHYTLLSILFLIREIDLYIYFSLRDGERFFLLYQTYIQLKFNSSFSKRERKRHFFTLHHSCTIKKKLINSQTKDWVREINFASESVQFSSEKWQFFIRN